MAITILGVGLLVFFGHFLADFFQRTKVPDVLILMLAGIVLGPILHIVEPGDFGKVGPVFTSLALIIILFEGGIHLNVKHLASTAGDTLTISLGSLAVTALLLALIADALLPIEFPDALFVGTVLGGTSSAVVLPLIRVLRMRPSSSAILFLESALSDVLVIVLGLGLLQVLAAQLAGSTTTVSSGALVGGIAKSFVMAGLIGAGGAFVWSAVLERIRRVPNTVFATIAYVFILFGVAELLGYSGAIAALAFGIAVANFPNVPEHLLGRVFSFRLAAFAEHERAFFAEAVFLVKTFFFVFLGVSITFQDRRAVAVGLALALAAFVARAPIVRLLAPTTMPRRDAALVSALVPKGLAAAVLASLPIQAGLPTGQIVQGTVYAAIFFSIVLGALLVFAIERGLLDRMSAGWLRKFPLAAERPLEEARQSLVFEESPVLADLSAFQEPNPIVDLTPPALPPETETPRE